MLTSALLEETVTLPRSGRRVETAQRSGSFSYATGTFRGPPKPPRVSSIPAAPVVSHENRAPCGPVEPETSPVVAVADVHYSAGGDRPSRTAPDFGASRTRLSATPGTLRLELQARRKAMGLRDAEVSGAEDSAEWD